MSAKLTAEETKTLVTVTKIYRATDVTDIPPTLWPKIGLKKGNEEKVNFLVHILSVARGYKMKIQEALYDEKQVDVYELR